MSALSTTRERLLGQARVHHVLCAMSAIEFSYPGSSWSDGLYAYDDGCGNSVVLAWDDDGVVALAFDHESERSEFDVPAGERDPRRWLPGLPASLASLASRAIERLDRCVTSGLWASSNAARDSDPLERDAPHGAGWLYAYTLRGEAALFGDALSQTWIELLSLSPAKGNLALDLAANVPCELTGEHDDVLLLGHDGAPACVASNARVASAMLAEVGIAWRVPEERIARAAAANETANDARIKAALGPLERALFEAVRSDRSDDVAGLIARGANRDARTLENQWPYTPAGDTPLVQALKTAMFAAAGALLDAGADTTLANAYGQTALHWAVRQGALALVERLLAHGADPHAATGDGATPLHYAAFEGEVAVVDLLLAAGAFPGARQNDGRTPGECARAAGHVALEGHLPAVAR